MSFDDGPGAQAAADSFARFGLSNGVGDSAGTTGLTQLSQAVAQAISFELVLHGYPGHLQPVWLLAFDYHVPDANGSKYRVTPQTLSRRILVPIVIPLEPSQDACESVLNPAASTRELGAFSARSTVSSNPSEVNGFGRKLKLGSRTFMRTTSESA